MFVSEIQKGKDETFGEDPGTKIQDDHKWTIAHNMIEKSWKNIFEALKLAYGLEYEKDDNFDDTPKRNARALLERCVGINSKDICKKLLQTNFTNKYKGMVIVNPITLHSLCPHHFEDVYYIVRVGYIPKTKCVGLSKIGRVVRLYGSQPILQEEYTKDLADMLMEVLDAEGVCVVTKGRHNCMVARGLKQHGVWVTMSEVRGSFLSNPSVKDEFFKLCKMTSNEITSL